MDKSELFSLAPRTKATIKVEGKELEVLSLSLDGRFAFSETEKKPLGERFAFLAIHGCPALSGSTIEEVVNGIDPIVLSNIAAKVMELSGLGADEGEEAGKSSEKGRK